MTLSLAFSITASVSPQTRLYIVVRFVLKSATLLIYVSLQLSWCRSALTRFLHPDLDLIDVQPEGTDLKDMLVHYVMLLLLIFFRKINYCQESFFIYFWVAVFVFMNCLRGRVRSGGRTSPTPDEKHIIWLTTSLLYGHNCGDYKKIVSNILISTALQPLADGAWVFTDTAFYSAEIRSVKTSVIPVLLTVIHIEQMRLNSQFS